MDTYHHKNAHVFVTTAPIPPLIIKLAGENLNFQSVFKNIRAFIASLEVIVGPLKDTHVGRSGDFYVCREEDCIFREKRHLFKVDNEAAGIGQ